MGITEREEKRPLYLFGEYTLDSGRRALYRGEVRVRLTSKPLETLIYLVEHSGHTVEKQELMDAVWKGTFVTDDNLVHAVREIRRALEDDKENPRFIQTVPREGYRFVAGVVERRDETAESLATGPAEAGVAIGINPVTHERSRASRRVTRPALFFTLAADGGQAAQVTKQGGREAIESPDGKFVYYYKNSGDSHGVWRVPVLGGEETLVLDQVLQGNWAILETGIYFTKVQPEPGPAIQFYSLTTKRVTQIALLEKQLIQGPPALAVSPDGRWILYAQMDQSGSDVMLVENFR